MPIRVLIAEDDTATRAALVMLLQGEGYTADSVSDGRAALAYLRSGAPAPHLIILDLMMPVMDGWQFLRERLKEAALAAIPVVVFTATGALDVLGLRRLGADHVLRKPADAGELLGVVERCRRLAESRAPAGG
jgi:CheY-like chemotaxis protein